MTGRVQYRLIFLTISCLPSPPPPKNNGTLYRNISRKSYDRTFSWRCTQNCLITRRVDSRIFLAWVILSIEHSDSQAIPAFHAVVYRAVAPRCSIKATAWEATVNCRLQALGLYNFVRGFRWVYKCRGLYPRGLITRIKKKPFPKRAIAVLIEIDFSFTGF